ncbi:MAG: hypothetical protein PHV37_00370 [Candidatus Gastranaerophilales bacterium]|nr:hypothetical protein [Candidatus Gastranaerophilales bacterium]
MNPQLLKFIIKNNLEESKAIEGKKEPKEIKLGTKMTAFSKLASVPVKIQE